MKYFSGIKPPRFRLRDGPGASDALWLLGCWSPVVVVAIWSLICSAKHKHAPSVKTKMYLWYGFLLMNLFWTVAYIWRPLNSPWTLRTLKQIGSLIAYPGMLNTVLSLLLSLRFLAPFRSIVPCYFALLPFHRYSGWAAFFFISAHTVLLSAYYLIKGNFVSELLPNWSNSSGWVNFFGVVGWVAQLVLTFSSLERIRRTRFRLFIVLHQLYLVYLVGTLLHVGVTMLYIVPPACLLLLDRLLSRDSELKKARLTRFEGTPIFCVDVENDDADEFHPGSYLRLEVPKLGIEEHPFSVVISAPDVLRCYIKPMDSWTKQFSQLEDKELLLRTHGVFRNQLLLDFSHDVVLIAGGVGIVSFISFVQEHFASESSAKINLLWSVQSSSDLVPFAEFIESCLYESRCCLKIFVTRASIVENCSILLHRRGNGMEVRKFRPKNWNMRRFLMALFAILMALVGFILGRFLKLELPERGCRAYGSFGVLLQCRIHYCLTPAFLSVIFLFLSALACRALVNRRRFGNKEGHWGNDVEPLLSTETHDSVQVEFTSGRMDVAQELQRYPRDFHVYASGPEKLVQQVKCESQRLGRAFFRESFTV